MTRTHIDSNLGLIASVSTVISGGGGLTKTTGYDFYSVRTDVLGRYTYILDPSSCAAVMFGV